METGGAELRIEELEAAILRTVHASDCRGPEPMIAAVRAAAKLAAVRGPPGVSSHDLTVRLLDVCIEHTNAFLSRGRWQ